MSSLRAQLRQKAKCGVEFASAFLPRAPHDCFRLVLGYHGVRDAGTPPVGERTLHIDAERFEQQMRRARADADVVSLTELLFTASASARLVAITFDDAYASALRNGVAVCSTLGLPCTVFVAPALLGTLPPWDLHAERGNWGEGERERWLAHEGMASAAHATPSIASRMDPIRIATEQELRDALARCTSLMLGNHTMNHVNLGCVSTEIQLGEVATAHTWLKAFAGRRYVPCVAYPFGVAPAIDDATTLLPESGFGFMARGGSFGRQFPKGRGLIPRWNVPAEVTANGFRARVRGRLLPHSP